MRVQQSFRIILLFIASFRCDIVYARNEEEPILIVISFDAFKPSYLRDDLTYFLKKFYTEGVIANNMGNCFPTKTFTNHFSIATGTEKELKILRFFSLISCIFRFSP